MMEMKLQNKLIFAVAATLLSGAAAAATIDYRHEWKEDDGDPLSESDRIKLGDDFRPFEDIKALKYNLSIELKFESADDTDTLKNPELTETEFEMGATYTYGKWQFKPGMPIALATNKTTIKPQFRIVYKADNGIDTALRYRHEFARFNEEGTGDTDGETGDKVRTPTKSKVTLTGSYKIEADKNIKLSYEANYIKSWDNVILSNNKDWEYDAGLILGYQLGNWRPYAELWTIDVDKTSSERQFKYRAGVKYNF
jgi:oligogalacturonate-specific porin family protein